MTNDIAPDALWPARRKKTRCPGERPGCSFCRRLHQDCRYDDDEPTAPSTGLYESVDVVSLVAPSF